MTGNMSQRASRITRFLSVQLIALIGWIIVQSFFSFTPAGRSVPFQLTLLIEAIWWIATLLIMFFLFRREYNGFVRAVLDLEEANTKLRKATSELLLELGEQVEKEQK